MTYWIANEKRFDDKKEAVLFLLKSFAGSVGEYALVDTWNEYCDCQYKPDKYIYWTRDLKNWFVGFDPDEIIEHAKKIANINPDHSWFIDDETGVKSSNSPADEGWIDFDALADWLIETDDLDEFFDFKECEE